jgi:hypothetical protein
MHMKYFTHFFDELAEIDLQARLDGLLLQTLDYTEVHFSPYYWQYRRNPGMTAPIWFNIAGSSVLLG